MDGVLHLMYIKVVRRKPSNETIKHILAEWVVFNFRRLFMYDPEKNNNNNNNNNVRT